MKTRRVYYKHLKNNIMRNLKRLTKKATEFCELSGLSVAEVKKAMKHSAFAFKVCENIAEMNKYGVDYRYPYVIYNPYNISLS